MNRAAPPSRSRPRTRVLIPGLAAIVAGLGGVACGGGEAHPAGPQGTPRESGAADANAEPPAPVASDPQALEREVAELRVALALAEAQKGELAAELSEERSLRYEREVAWLDYTQTVASLDVESLIDARFATHLPGIGPLIGPEQSEEIAPVPTPEEIARRIRAEGLAISLRNLMRIEEVYGIDLLELGELGEGEDAAGGFYALHRYEGVRDGEFLEVQLTGFDERGRLERRLFCDHMRIVAQDRGVQLVLQDGAIIRGDETMPFPSGVFRIFLPTANVAAWRAARLPGLAEPLRQAAEAADPGPGSPGSASLVPGGEPSTTTPPDPAEPEPGGTRG